MRIYHLERVYISRSRTGLPCVGVGGGSKTNTFEGVFVLRQGQLPQAIFLRQSGPLACSTSQAIVPLKKGDIIVEVTGHLPVDPDNPDVYWNVGIWNGEIKEENGEYAVLEEVPELPQIPEEVRKGLSSYHNRSGSYFCVPPASKK